MSMKQHLVEDNINLVYYIISKEYPTYLHDDDIIQSGMLGLCRAAEGWNEERGSFANYAGKWIRGEIKQEFVRRKPHAKNISLETTIGEDGTLGDLIPGDDDVAYIDDDTFCRQLTTDERMILTLDSVGYSAAEIAQISGFDVQKVRKLRRIIRLKWRDYYEC